jgi:hypothetical protein
MTDRSRSKMSACKSNYSNISRRDVLRAGATIIPASIIVPAWLTANAQTTTTTFDYYISPTGSDANPGTLASPWAITSLSLYTHNANNVANCRATAGKRVGLLPSAATHPGTYDISGLMYQGATSASTGALQFIGGTSSSPTYVASCNSSGVYSPRTATLDARGASGLFGGGHSSGAGVTCGPMVAHIGSYPSTYATGWLTIDGIRFIGGSYKGIRIGGLSSTDGSAITNPVIIQNCEFTAFGFNAGDTLDNCAQVWIDGCNNAPITVTNNWLHDSAPPAAGSAGHFNAIIQWGAGAKSTGTIIQFNTITNAGNIFGKEGGNEGSTIQYNYVDVSMFTQGPAIQDFTGNGQGVSGLSAPNLVQNNIVIVQGGVVAAYDDMCGLSTLSNEQTLGWMAPVTNRNNTVINVGSSGAMVGQIQAEAGSAALGNQQLYNNIYVNAAGSGSFNSFGNYRANPACVKVLDYNLSPSSGVQWVLSQNSSLGTGTIYSTPASFSGAMVAAGGPSVEAHSIRGAPTFVGTGLYAAQYQLQSGSLGKGTGSTNGTTGGSATDMGAWGNGATQIGCNFTTGAKVPDSPAPLTVS